MEEELLEKISGIYKMLEDTLKVAIIKAEETGDNIKRMAREESEMIVTDAKHNASRIVSQDYSAPTVMENHGTITATQITDLRIRKLTPKECFRLMGVNDSDYENVARNQSNSSLYHLAGDSIVVNVLMAIFKEML